MGWLPRVFGMVVHGSPTNWWGVGCPAHCHTSGLPTVILPLALGFILGACACLWAFGFVGPAHHLSAVLVTRSCGILVKCCQRGSSMILCSSL